MNLAHYRKGEEEEKNMMVFMDQLINGNFTKLRYCQAIFAFKDTLEIERVYQWAK